MSNQVIMGTTIPATATATASGQPHQPIAQAFGDHVNPHLLRVLRALDIDRRYVRAAGSTLWDDSGREVLDFTAQYGALPFGYNPPELWRALLQCQERELPSFAQPSVLGPATELATKLVRCAPPGLRYVTFANSGAEAVEVALKLAFACTARSGVVSAHGGFHGKTLGALSCTQRESYQSAFGLPLPGFAAVRYNDPAALERLLAADPERYAVFVVEPVQGEAGVIVPNPDYLRKAREICRRYGVLLAVDEVQTGLGRTGRLFATDDAVEPDMLMLAKALGGGLLPMAACLCRPEVYSRAFALKHSSTFAGHALGACVGLEVLERLTNPAHALLAQVEQRGAFLRDGLVEAAARHPGLVRAVRGRGLMIGVELQTPQTGAPLAGPLAVAAEQQSLAALFASYMLRLHGIRVAHTLNHGNVLRVQPALTISHAHCERFVRAFEATLEVFTGTKPHAQAASKRAHVAP